MSRRLGGRQRVGDGGGAAGHVPAGRAQLPPAACQALLPGLVGIRVELRVQRGRRDASLLSVSQFKHNSSTTTYMEGLLY